VNSTLPVAAEALKKAGVFEPTRIFGVTTLDVVRASTFAAHALGGNANPKDFKVPVIGGHSGATILPLYSQAQPPVNLDDEILANVINSKLSFPPISDDLTDIANRSSIWR
jgi:malate dehydrogenase